MFKKLHFVITSWAMCRCFWILSTYIDGMSMATTYPHPSFPHTTLQVLQRLANRSTLGTQAGIYFDFKGINMDSRFSRANNAL